MAVVVSNVIPGGNQDLYDRVSEKLGFAEALPEGCQLHIAGPVDEGWRVITVWDSSEAFEGFRDGTLVPTLQEVSGGQATPQPSVTEAYKVITA